MRTLLACLLVLPLLSGFARAQGSSCAFIRGDANGSGAYQPTTDYTYILAYLYSSGPAPNPMDAGDANDDGVVDVADATYLANYDSAGPAPPAPFSSAGYDPSPDPNNTECDAILGSHALALTSYLPSGASSLQDIRPLVLQRGVGLDGSGRARPSLPLHFAGNASEPQHLPDEVLQEATGTFEVFDVDLALPASGFSWVVGRTYNARQQTSGGSARDSNGYQGKNWFQVSQPEIVHYDGATDSKDVVYLLYGADRFIEFKRLDSPSTSTTFRATNGAAGVMVFTSGGASVPDTYAYTDQHGYTHTFFGFDGDAGSAAGQYWKTVDPDGQVAYVGHATTPATAISSGYSSGRILYAYDTADRRYTYTYTSLNGTYRLTEVKAETKTGGTWDGTPTGVTEVASVDYAYYGDESNGDIGDLKTVTVSLPLTDAGDSIQKRYYRYYEGAYNETTNPGYPHHLKLVLGPEGTRNFDYNGGTPDSSFDDDFLTASTDDLKPYGAAYFTYDTSHRVTSCWTNGACGCSGGLTGTHTLTYATNGSDDTSGYGSTTVRYRTVVERPDGGFVSLYFDEVGQPLARVLTDADPSGSPTKTWATLLNRDSAGVVVLHSTPANVTAYTHSTGAFTTSSSVGLVHHSVRETTPNLKGYVLDRKWSEGTSGSAYLNGTLTYTTATLTVGASKVVRPFVASTREYPQAVTSGTSGSNLTQIATTVHSGTLMPETVTVTLPDVVTGNNGEGATSTTHKRYFTKRGENTYQRSIDGIITHRAFTSGQLTSQIADADTDVLSEPTGFTSSGTELDETTTHTYDAQGRRTRTTLPSGESKDVYYSELDDRRLVTLTYNDKVSTTFYGPVQYRVVNFAGNEEASAIVCLPSNSSTTAQADHIDEGDADPITAVNGSWSLRHLVTTLYDSSGSRESAVRAYFLTPAYGAGVDGTNYDATTYGYDDSGRVWRVEESHGTVTRTLRDLNGSTLETWVGTNDNDAYFPGGDVAGTENMVKTTAFAYDGGSGGGNQYLTSMTTFVVDGSTDQRVTTFTNDARGRRIIEARPASPHALHKYDNLGRQIATGLYSSTSGQTAGSDPTSVSSNRLALSQTLFDERGQVWKTQRHKIDAGDGSDDDNLQALAWYDRAGRVCKRDATMLERVRYDRLGRETHRFVLASDNDTNYVDLFDENGDVDLSGDTVLAEHQRVYEADSGDLLMEARIDRHHDSGATGALDSNADNDTLLLTAGNIVGRVQITAHWYDQFGRVQDTVQYGTYGGSTFDRDGLSAPTRSATALRTTYTYNTAGALEVVEDPRSLDAYTGYDDAGRVVKRVANASANPPGDPTGSDSNQTVLYGYTDDNLTTYTADMPSGTSDQVTTYTYGTVTGAGASDSALATGHFLFTVQYPDSGGGVDVVTHAYNAQGQLIWKQDQGGSVLDLTYDLAGRLTAQTVSTVGSGFDNAVRRIGTTYTSLGQVNEVTQYSDTAGSTVVDQVEYTWDGWGLPTKFAQDHDTVVSGSGDYYYDFQSTWAKATGGRNTLRRSTLTLPTSRAITLDYASGTDANASRVTSLKDGGTTLATYAYNGVNQVVGIDYPVPDVFRNYHGGGGYPSFDRFNRVVSLEWTKDLTVDQAFVDLDYSYDENSNPTLSVDNIHIYAGRHGFDNKHSYDNLNRLTASEQGHWSGSVITDDSEFRDWTLDHAGNWTNERLNLNGDADFSDTDEYNDARTHNAANEITLLHGQDAGDGLSYDANGNLTNDANSYKYAYDSFNRLRVVKSQGNSTLAEYRYNGLGYLIAVRNDTDGDGAIDADDPWYHHIYDERWRKVATYRHTDTNAKKLFLYHEHGLGESTQRNDALALQERDASTAWSATADALDETLYYSANWRGDVVALVQSNGRLVEWAKYAPYGESFGYPGGDTDGDFDCDSADVTQIQTWIDAPTYDVLGDLELDKDVDATDKSLANGAPYKDVTLGRGSLSSRRNTTGYASYPGDEELAHLRHKRHSVQDVEIGRRLQRDVQAMRPNTGCRDTGLAAAESHTNSLAPGIPNAGQQSAMQMDIAGYFPSISCTGHCDYLCSRQVQFGGAQVRMQWVPSAFPLDESGQYGVVYRCERTVSHCVVVLSIPAIDVSSEVGWEEWQGAGGIPCGCTKKFMHVELVGDYCHMGSAACAGVAQAAANALPNPMPKEKDCTWQQ